MHLVEIIRVRLFDHENHSKLESVFADIQAGFPNMRACLYRRSRVDNDWSVHLYQPVGQGGAETSDLGRRLAESLKSLGLVQHNVWKPVWFSNEIFSKHKGEITIDEDSKK